MSTKGYSNDLRERVIEYLEGGGDYQGASKRYRVSISALGRWYRRYKKEGSYEARKRVGAKRKIDLIKLRDYIQMTPDARLKELSKRFGVSIFSISYWLKRLGFSYKKKPFAMWKQISRSEIDIQNLSDG